MCNFGDFRPCYFLLADGVWSSGVPSSLITMTLYRITLQLVWDDPPGMEDDLTFWWWWQQDKARNNSMTSSSWSLGSTNFQGQYPSMTSNCVASWPKDLMPHPPTFISHNYPHQIHHPPPLPTLSFQAQDINIAPRQVPIFVYGFKVLWTKQTNHKLSASKSS